MSATPRFHKKREPELTETAKIVKEGIQFKE